MDMKNIDIYNYFTCFLTGFAILALEIISFRMLAPYFGNSSFVIGVIINSILLALAVGYLLGGYYADRKKSRNIPYIVIIASSFYLLIIYFTYPVILRFLSNKSVIAGSLLSVLIIFFIPMVLLSFIPPYLIKILTLKDNVGTTSGRIFSISTIGSILGGILTTFVFIPFLGSKISFFLIIILLFVVGVIGIVNHLWIHFILIFVFILPFTLSTSHIRPGLLYEGESGYNIISVAEKDEKLFLMLNDNVGLFLMLNDNVGFQSVSVNRMTNLTGFYYDRHLFAHLIVDAKRTLILGNGAGTIMSQISYFFNTEIDGVELDPAITKVGEEYFSLNLDEMKKVYHEDARVFLLKNTKKYDIIHIDLYAGSPYIPFHLATEEFFALIFDSLNEGGIMVVNFPDFAMNTPLVDNYLSTITKIFPDVFLSKEVIYAFTSNTELEEINDMIKKKNITGSLAKVRTIVLTDIERIDIRKETFTDDHAPIEMMTYQVFKR